MFNDEEDWDLEINSGISCVKPQPTEQWQPPPQRNTSNFSNQNGVSPTSLGGRSRGRGFWKPDSSSRSESDTNWRNNDRKDSDSDSDRSFGSGRGFGRGSRGRGGSFGRGGRGRGRDFGSRNENDGNSYGSNDNMICISVPSNGVGRIIGKGGSKIRELESDSGARIKILSDESEDGETKVQLRGSTEAQAKAKEMIEDIFKSDRMTNSFRGLPPIKKDFYIESHAVANMYPDEIAQFRKQNNNITVHNLSKDGSGRIPNPVRTFEEAFDHFPEILDTIYNQGFVKPSPIQAQAWPVLLQGMDLIGIAQTGTGKTLAFLLPAFIHIDNQPVVCVYGGGNRREQINVVTKGVEIIVATPGRLNDLVMNGIIDVKSVTYLVLDEADRIATWPPDVRRLGESYLTNPIQVFVGSLDLAVLHADDLASDFTLHGIICQCIHGDRYVFNYDFPRNMEEYVHRIGRTGRAGKTGTALTLLTRGDWRSAQHLIDIMEEANQIVPQNLIDMAERYEAFKRKRQEEREMGIGGGGRFGGQGGGRGGRRREEEIF
ncbi:hypothetical protein KUTeg_016186 [Tegillarca granosa]|uniref:RNA helicase n=1 Tax=Tegillarca granosa TaxID=220873 RepID=A0ABQ9EMN1_TEGGR|nr:hypothetical protein KUTeg_016186 [Tegillarca granosa]